MSSAFGQYLEATVRTATPLALAALGETVVERAGIINIGLEGMILGGAFAALVGASAGSTALGLLSAILAGMALALLFALFVLALETDQIIAGTALNMLAFGLTGTLYRSLYGTAGAALTTPTLGPLTVPGLAQLPMIGAAFFRQPLPTYIVYLIVPAITWWMFRTHAGLALRATGESPESARTSGVAVGKLRLIALLFGGAMGGLAGGTLVLAQVGTFAESMSAGRGFIAIAIVVLGRWHPAGVVVAALVFGAAGALQYLTQALGLGIPYSLILALPYVLTLVALALGGWRTRGWSRTVAPRALGRR